MLALRQHSQASCTWLSQGHWCLLFLCAEGTLSHRQTTQLGGSRQDSHTDLSSASAPGPRRSWKRGYQSHCFWEAPSQDGGKPASPYRSLDLLHPMGGHSDPSVPVIMDLR